MAGVAVWLRGEEGREGVGWGEGKWFVCLREGGRWVGHSEVRMYGR